MMRLQLGGASEEGGPRQPGSKSSPPERSSPASASNDLMGNSLASYFSQLFEQPPLQAEGAQADGQKGRGDKKKCKKCKKVSKAKDKRKVSS